MKYLSYILLIALTPVISWSQSLINNFSFEELTDCPDQFDQVDKLAFWNNIGGSVDVFSECSLSLVPDPPNGPFDYADFEFGDSYIFLKISFPFRLKSDTIFREYLQGELTKELTNTTYYFSAHINTNQENRTNHLGLYFSAEDNGFIGSYPKDIEPQYEFDEWIGGYDTWQKHEACIDGIGGANYITIGNFHEPGNDLVEYPDIEFSNGIFMDNVILKELPDFVDTSVVIYKGESIGLPSTWNGISVLNYTSDENLISGNWSPTENSTITQAITSCAKIRKITVEVIDCDCELHLPNVLSSNSQNIANSVINLGYNSSCIDDNFDLQIFSRWGNRVFSGHPDQFDAHIIQQGVYVYLINYRCRGQSYSKRSDITILK